MKAYLGMFRNYINFADNTVRREFWSAILIHWLVSGVLWGMSIALNDVTSLFEVLIGVYSLLSFIPILAIMVRRLKDADKSIANLLWSLVPVIGTLILIVKLTKPSKSIA